MSKCPVGCPNYIPKPRGQCKNKVCNTIITDDYPCITDNENNHFCSHDCFDTYHGYSETDNWEDKDE